MRVRLTQQPSGSRDGAPWPAVGEEVDLPETEARALISGGVAVEPGHKSDTVLVPPKGVHTPGTVAMPRDVGGPLVEAPADAVADPEGARRAVEAAARGDFVESPAGIALQQSSGAAHTPESLKQAGEAERAAREALGVAQPSRPSSAGSSASGQTKASDKPAGSK